ncbi:glycosyltransferase [Algoriphagus sp.]|uniref:glycosyltransferase n=1 Tax=Algoriphagus sp. TaxID=1872435 RepID=UPI00260EEB24|nr:glycosyltransferase [Algoriphagus sp.]
MNGIFIHQQIKALQDLGHSCHVILTYNWYPPLGFHRFHPYWREGYELKSNFLSDVEGVQVHQVPVLIKMPSRWFNEDPYEREANSILNYLNNHKEIKPFDWIISHFWTETSWIGILLKQKLNLPLAAFCRGDDIHEWPLSNSVLFNHLKEVYHHADLLLANSYQLGQDAQALLGAKKSRKIEVVYNGVDLVKFFPVSTPAKLLLKEKFRWDPNHIQVLCVATPVKLKGWIELLDAFKILVSINPSLQLKAVTVTRNFPDKLDLAALAKERGMEDKLELLGQIPHSELAEIYQAADLFVLPSYNEGLANVALEAAATNLPLVLTDVGGHREIFESAKSVSLVPAKNQLALVDGILDQLKWLSIEKPDSRYWVEKKVGNYKKNASRLLNFLAI